MFLFATEGEFVIGLIYNGLIIAALIVGGVYLWRRQKRMVAVLETPESEEERRQRLTPPPGLQNKPVPALIEELRDDLKYADAYLETAQVLLGKARFWSFLDIFGYEFDGGEGGNKQDRIGQLLDEMIHAEKFLANAQHILRVLHKKDQVSLPFSTDLVDFALFDWVLDNPFSDYVTHRKLGALKPVLAQARDSIHTLLPRLG